MHLTSWANARLEVGYAGAHPSNLIVPIVVAVTYSDLVLTAPKYWWAKDIDYKLGAELLSPSGITPNGICLVKVLHQLGPYSVMTNCLKAKKSLTIGITAVAISQDLSPPKGKPVEGYLAYTVAHTVRQIYLEQWHDAFPSLGILQHKGHATPAHMKALRALSIIPPFYYKT